MNEDKTINIKKFHRQRLNGKIKTNSRNRLDAIIQFEPLAPATILRVVDKFLIELEAQLEEKKVGVDTDDAARAWLAEHGYDPTMVARPMARLIQERIKAPLAEELLFGRLAGGGQVKIGVTDGKLHLQIEPSAAPRRPEPTSLVDG